MIILHAKSDTTVPYAAVESFCQKATTQGNQWQLVGYEGAGHGFSNSQNGEGK